MRMDAGIPKIGLVGMALPGLFMGEETCPGKFEEVRAVLEKEGYQVVWPEAKCVDSREEALSAGRELAALEVDCLVAALATFVPEFFITELLKGCDRPVFLWAVDRELACIPMVCTPLITASLYNLNKDCCVCAGETEDPYTLGRLSVYARAAMLQNRLKKAKVGYCGYKPAVMYSMEANAYLLDKTFGLTTIPIPVEEFYETAEKISVEEVEEKQREITEAIGCMHVREEDLERSVRYYLAARKQVKDYGMSAYSINCFPHLKAKICLAVALLNDEGIGAGCEGDLHASILMYLAEHLTGQAAFNGDFLKLYPEKNQVMFSHCGAGAFSLAESCREVCLKQSAETCDGVGVFYRTSMPGTVTLLNLMNGLDELRLSCMVAEGTEDVSGYEGTPLTLSFAEDMDVRSLPDLLARAGAGHHWVGLRGDHREVFEILARMCGLSFRVLYDLGSGGNDGDN